MRSVGKGLHRGLVLLALGDSGTAIAGGTGGGCIASSSVTAFTLPFLTPTPPCCRLRRDPQAALASRSAATAPSESPAPSAAQPAAVSHP